VQGIIVGVTECDVIIETIVYIKTRTTFSMMTIVANMAA